ncbi:MAG: hypothetical protein JST40_10380 [Armatimonadetes bacterium]|nr:hypothetical protein [Armatimonadota bacterium]
MKDWLIFLSPPRPDFMTTATSDEQRIVGEHFLYLKGLLQQGVLVMAGPKLDGSLGIAVMQAESEEKVRSLCESDPAVVGGVFRYEVFPYGLALLRGRDDLSME